MSGHLRTIRLLQTSPSSKSLPNGLRLRLAIGLYLAYRNRVEQVERDDGAVMILEGIRQILSGNGREIDRECEGCMFKVVCKNV